MQEVGSICSELVRLRNLAAHNSGLQNTSQALILLSNILRLLNLTPDVIRESTSNFDYLKDHIQKDYLDSILAVIRPDIEEEVDELNEIIEARKSKDKSSEEQILENKIDKLSNQVKDLNDIKNINNSLAESQASINEIRSILAGSKGNNKNITQESLVKKTKNKTTKKNIDYKEYGGSLSRSEAYDNLMKLRAQIKKEMNQIYSGFRKKHNILDEPLALAMLNDEIISLKSLKASSSFKNVIKLSKLSSKELKPLNGSKNPKDDYINIQIDEYWPKIKLILDDYFNQK